MQDTDQYRKMGEVYSLIPKGKKNAAPLRSIASAAHLTVRSLKAVVLDITLSGHPIAGTQSGYYIPATLTEWNEYRAYLKARKESTEARYKAVDNYIMHNYGGRA